MRGKITILVGFVVIAGAAGLAPARSEACEFFRRVFCCWQGPESVPPPEISPGVPVYPEESVSYRYTPAYGTVVYYGTPVVTYYRAPSTTVYYSGPSCASSAEPTPAPVPGPQTEPEEAPPTYAPEEVPQAFDQQELRKFTPAEEQSGQGENAPSEEQGVDDPQPSPLPEIEEDPDSGNQDPSGSAHGGERVEPRHRITALPATPRTFDSRSAKRPVVRQAKRSVSENVMPRWVPVAKRPSVAIR